MTPVLSPCPIFHQDTATGVPASGYKLFTYAAGTTSKQATYTDSTGGTSNTNPVVLDTNGNANVWLDPALEYKFEFCLPTDTDPPTNPIWTVDEIDGSDLSGINIYGLQWITWFNLSPFSSELLALWSPAANLQFPANFLGSTTAPPIINPLATFVLNVNKQVAGVGSWTVIGTVTITTGGTVTLATTGGAAINVNAGDRLSLTGPATADIAVAGFGCTFKGTAR